MITVAGALAGTGGVLLFVALVCGFVHEEGHRGESVLGKVAWTVFSLAVLLIIAGIWVQMLMDNGMEL